MGLFFRRRGLLDDGSSVSRSRGGLLLTPPSYAAFLLSLALAAIALLIRYTTVDVPIINSAYVFEVLLIAYAILALSILIGRRF